MNPFPRWTRKAGAVAAAAVFVAFASTATAEAAPARTAATAHYSSTGYLHDALGLPTTAKPIIESITYDRFQWQLKQPGKFAYLIGDPATDASFASRAQDVWTVADQAGVKKVYWFDPNLTGNAKVGAVTEPNLDIRKPAGITSLASNAQTIYGYAWLNLIANYLGNGASTTITGAQFTSGAKLTATAGPTGTVNDYGSTPGFSTKVGNASGGALFDYTSGSAPADVADSYFFLYDKDNITTAADSSPKPAKIVSWVNLTKQADSTAAQAAVTTAINTCGAANILALDEFSWWKSANNQWQVTSSPNEYQGSGNPNLTDEDGAGGWNVHQVTYPELVYLLKTGNAKDSVYLFGGTWCPNTRPILPSINRYAKENDVTVINFDTILDGSIVGGGNSGSNPLQVRGPAANGGTTNFVPSFVYGDLLTQYLSNLKTEYTPTQSNRITFYPGGDTTQALSSQPKLQVPFLFAHKGTAGDTPAGGVTRQWIFTKDDGTFTEYMSVWHFTNPQPNQLGVSPTTLPREAPIWSTINARLPDVTWQTDPATLVPNSAIDTDDAQYLVAADRANVTNTGSSSSNAAGTVVISPDALSAALAALGSAAPANLAAAKAAYVAALSGSDATLTANLKTVVGAWGVAQTRKTTVSNIWGKQGSPSSVIGAKQAIHAADVFFGGLPGGVVTRRTVTKEQADAATPARLAIAIAHDPGRVPTRNVSLVVRKGGATVASDARAVADGTASFTLPVLNAGAYDYTLSYAGDDQIAGFTESGTVDLLGPTPPGSTPGGTKTTPGGPTVTTPITGTKRTVSKVKGVVTKAPTRRKGGTYKVTITAPKGGSAATGKVTITLKKGRTTKRIAGTLSRGVVSVKVPKLAKGTWKVTISWPGDAKYRKASATGAAIKVTK